MVYTQDRSVGGSNPPRTIMMINVDDIEPFPIQAETRKRNRFLACNVPFWLAQLAYREYAKGHNQPLQTIAKRGGFGRAELIALIRGDFTESGIRNAQADLDKEHD